MDDDDIVQKNRKNREEQEQYFKDKYKDIIFEKKFESIVPLTQDPVLIRCLEKEAEEENEKAPEDAYSEASEDSIEEDDIATKQFSESTVNTRLNVISTEKRKKKDVSENKNESSQKDK